MPTTYHIILLLLAKLFILPPNEVEQSLPIGNTYTQALGAYTGPGDVTPGALAWWGLRAYSSATRGAIAINVCNVADVACADVSTNASTGALPASIVIGGSDCSLVTCTVARIYDQTLSGLCTGSCDLVQATIGSRFTLTANCINTTFWCLTGGNAVNETAANILTTPVTQPFSSTVIGERTANFTTRFDFIGTQNGGVPAFGRTGGNTSTNQWFIYSGGVATATASDSAFHTGNVLFNGNSSIARIDGTSNTGLAAGASAINSGLCFGCNNATSSLLIVEGGFWTGDQSANFATMNTNQHTFWGF